MPKPLADARLWRDRLAAARKRLWAGAIPGSAEDSFALDCLARLARAEENDERAFARRSRGGAERAAALQVQRVFRRILIEAMLAGAFGDATLDLPERLRRHPTGPASLKAIRERLEKIDRATPKSRLKFRAADAALKRDIAAVRR
jgi:hypothetical protein